MGVPSKQNVLKEIERRGGILEFSQEENERSCVWSICFIHDADLQGFDFSLLNRCPELEWLIVSMHSEVGDDSILRLKDLVHLRYVRLSGTSIGDRAVKHLAALSSKLNYIDLYGTHISDTSASVLAKCPDLEDIVLQDTAITDTALSALANCPVLESLDVSWTHVTGAGIMCLKDVKTLETITFGGIRLNELQQNDLRRAFEDMQYEAFDGGSNGGRLHRVVRK